MLKQSIGTAKKPNQDGRNIVSQSVSAVAHWIPIGAETKTHHPLGGVCFNPPVPDRSEAPKTGSASRPLLFRPPALRLTASGFGTIGQPII